MLLSRRKELAYFLHRGCKGKLRGCKASTGKGQCNLNFSRVDIINVCSLLVNALWARGLRLTLRAPSKPTPTQRRSQKTTFGKVKILRKNCHVLCEESFLWEVAAPQRARLDALLTANIVIDFTTAVVKESIRPKQKNCISITSSAFVTHTKKEHQEATSDMLLQPLRPPFPATFGIFFQLSQWQPVSLVGAPLTFCLWLSYWCKCARPTHTHTHTCVLVWKSKAISTQWEVYDQREAWANSVPFGPPRPSACGGQLCSMVCLWSP